MATLALISDSDEELWLLGLRRADDEDDDESDDELDQDDEGEGESTVEAHRNRSTNAFALAVAGMLLAVKAGQVSQPEFDGEFADVWDEHAGEALQQTARTYGVEAEALAVATAAVVHTLASKAAGQAVGLATRLASGQRKASTAQITAAADGTAGALWASHWAYVAQAENIKHGIGGELAEHVPGSKEHGRSGSIGRRRMVAMWIATGDERVCADCGELHGQEWAVDDIQQYPGDGTTACMGACRCALEFRVLPEGESGPEPAGLGQLAKGLSAALDETEREIIKHGRYEEAVLYDDEGRELFRKTGGKSSVSFTENEVARFVDKVLTHNHPSGVSLSPTDIHLAIETNHARDAGSRVAVPLLDSAASGRLARPD